MNAFRDRSALARPGARVVLDLGGDGAAVSLGEHSAFPRVPIVVRGKVRGAGGTTGINVHRDNLPGDLHVDSHAAIETTGGARGLHVGVSDETPEGVVRLHNFGRVLTTGEGTAEEPRRGYGVSAWSEKADLEVSNEVDATIETRGAAGRGLYASLDRDGTAKAVNRGSIVTKGGGSGDRYAEGLRADSGRAAEAVNEAGATVRTEGAGARGVQANACWWTGESCRADQIGSATAINRGTVTTTGDSVTGSGGGIRNPYGVYASVSAGGTARAVNEARASIRTEGTGARGLRASHEGSQGRAEAENHGEIVTTGGTYDSGRRQADGLTGWSKSRSVQAVNHQGATITTEGVAAQGISASVGRGGADTSAVAINRGTIRTSGASFRNESRGRMAHGMGASTGYDGAPSAARVEAVNEATGVIETRGDGAIGIFARAGADGSGAVQATNRGRVTTRGDVFRFDPEGEDGDYSLGANGVTAGTTGSGAATAANEVGGVVETHGTMAFGLRAWSVTGAAKVVNEGRVTTHQSASATGLPGSLAGREVGAYGAFATSRSGNAVIENEPTGRVETRGRRALGLFAEIESDGSRTSAMAEVRNRGEVITGGWNADGVVAIARGGGTADNPNLARVFNERGATVTTAGDGASAVAAGVLVAGSGTVDASGSVRAENHGTVATSGGLIEGSEPWFGAVGVVASFFKYGSTTIGNAGDVTVVNTGRVAVSGAQAAGLVANTSGTGKATVAMTGGRVAAAHLDDAGTEEVDEGGTGIFARTGATGAIEVTVSGSAEVTAPTAVRLVGGGGADRVELDLFDTSTLTGRVDLTRAANGAHFTIRDGFMDGAVAFGAGDDHLRVERRGYVSGGIDFGDGTDTLTIDVRGAGAEASNFGGAISGIEYIYKRGAGVARVGDVAFSGSALALEEGGLTVAGHLDLGSEGVLTVHDGTRLAVEVGDVTRDAADHGRITAGGGLVYQGLPEGEAPAVYVLLGADAAGNRAAVESALQQEATAITVLGDGTVVRRRADAEGSEPSAVAEVALKTTGAGGAEQDVGALSGDDGKARVQLAEGQQLGLAAAIEPPAPDPELEPAPAGPAAPSGGASKGDGLSGGEKALLIGGGAWLAAWLVDLFDAEEAALADWEEQGSGRRSSVSFAGIGSGHFEEHRVRTGGLERWTRTFAGRLPSAAGGAEGTVRGVALGLDARLARGFHLGMTAMPDLAGSLHAGPGSRFGSALEGGWYAVHGGWSDGARFADTRLTHGSYRAGSLFESPAAGGTLGGSLGLAQRHARARAGVHLDLGGLRATPTVALFSGSLRQDAWTAHGAALRAEVPGVSQRYRGWKARLGLAPAGWLEGPGALRWRPGAHLGTTRTRTRGPAWLAVAQSDRAGVLSFTSRARVRGLPRTVHHFGAGLVAKGSDTWSFQAGYAGMEVDGETVHAAVAGLEVRF